MKYVLRHGREKRALFILEMVKALVVPHNELSPNDPRHDHIHCVRLAVADGLC